MSQPISEPERWRTILYQRRLANIEYCLHQLDSCDDLAAFVLEEYDNLLRTLESTLQQDATFDLAYRLIQKLSFVVFGYMDWDRWLVYLQEAVKMSSRLAREAERAFLLERICHIYVEQSNHQQAEILYRQTAEIYQRLGDLESYGYTLSRLGQLTYNLHQNLPASVALCEQAIELGHQLQKEVLVGHAYDALAYVYQGAREWETSLRAAQVAYNIFKNTEYPRMKEHLLSRIVSAYIFLEDWKNVNKFGPQLTEMFLTVGDIVGLATLKNNLGIAAFKQANYELAEALWQEALSLQSQIQRPFSLANVYNNLGKVYTKMGEWEVAYDFLDKSISLFDRLGDMPGWANSMDNLVDLYEARGQIDKCRLVLEQVLTRLQNISADVPVQKLLNSMRQRLQALPS